MPLTSFALVWDGIHYIEVAQRGYPDHLTIVDGRATTSLHAFFPLYPIAIRSLERLLPIGLIGTALLISSVAGAVAAVLLWRLADRLAGPAVADTAVVLFCFFPGSFVLGWAFSEALMLCFAIGAVLLLLQERIWAAAALTALASATRPNAIVLVLSFAWLALVAIRSTEWRLAGRYLAAGFVGSLGFVGFHVYLWVLTGEPLAWFRVQREGFGEGVQPGRRTLEVLFKELPANSRTPAPLFTLFLVVLGVALIVAVLAARTLPAWLRIYAIVILMLALTSNTGPGSPRLQLVAFPAFIAAAQFLRGEVRTVAVAASSMLLVVLVLAYANPVRLPFIMWAP